MILNFDKWKLVELVGGIGIYTHITFQYIYK